MKAKDILVEELAASHEDYIKENFNLSLEDMTNKIILEHIQSTPAEQVSIQQKQDIVTEMQSKGLFLMKGAVTVAADALNVSEQSIYRYIKNSKKTNKENYK